MTRVAKHDPAPLVARLAQSAKLDRRGSSDHSRALLCRPASCFYLRGRLSLLEAPHNLDWCEAAPLVRASAASNYHFIALDGGGIDEDDPVAD